MIAHTGRKASTGMAQNGTFLRVSDGLHVGRHRLGGLRHCRHHGGGRLPPRSPRRSRPLRRCVGSSAAAAAGAASASAVAAAETEGGAAVTGALEQVLGNFGHSSSEGVGRVRVEAHSGEGPVRRQT